MRTQRKCRRELLWARGCWWHVAACVAGVSSAVAGETPRYFTPVTNQPRHGNNQKVSNLHLPCLTRLKMPKFKHSEVKVAWTKHLIPPTGLLSISSQISPKVGYLWGAGQINQICWVFVGWLKRNSGAPLQYTPAVLITVYWPYIDSHPRLSVEEIDNRVSLSQWAITHTIKKFTDPMFTNIQ